MRILHLSADYPDPLVPSKTRAIANLLALSSSAEHCVYSLNRIGWRAGVHALDFADAAGERHRAVAYGAPPRGLFLARFLDRLADWIAEDLARRGIAPDAVHAHKLSVEGLLGQRLAGLLGAPLIVSSQGDSDLKILGARPDLRGRWRRVWRDAAVALPFAPWTAERIVALLGPRTGPTRLLPCPSGGPERMRAPKVAGPVLRSAFHLASSGRKNADGLIRAVALAAKSEPELRLEIAGGGDPAAFARLSGLAETVAPGRVRFRGAVPHAEMPDFFSGAAACAMVSHRESFGMVFVEALFAGAPCVIPKGWAIDGYLAEGAAVMSSAPEPEAIAETLLRATREEAAFKARLAALQESGGLDLFRRETVAATYADALSIACGAAAAEPGGAAA